MGHPGLFLFIFIFSASKHYHVDKKSMLKDVHPVYGTGIQNRRPSEHESPPITTKARLTPSWRSFYNRIHDIGTLLFQRISSLNRRSHYIPFVYFHWQVGIISIKMYKLIIFLNKQGIDGMPISRDPRFESSASSMRPVDWQSKSLLIRLLLSTLLKTCEISLKLNIQFKFLNVVLQKIYSIKILYLTPSAVISPKNLIK